MKCNALYAQAPQFAETWVLVFDVALRKEQMLLALRALIKGRAIAPDSSALALRTVQVSITKSISNTYCTLSFDRLQLQLLRVSLARRTL